MKYKNDMSLDTLESKYKDLVENPGKYDLKPSDV